MLIVGHKQQVEKLKAKIRERWKSKDLGPVSVFCGFQVVRDRQRRTVRIHQSLYIKKLLERLGMANANVTVLPIPANTVMREKEEFDTLDDDETYLYRSIVGSSIYLSNNTRLDISYTVGQLARFMSKPRVDHLRYAKNLLRYLKGTINVGITYSGNRIEYSIYTDSTWGTEDDRVSFQGWVVIQYNGAISWAAQRQKSTVQSSIEAEIIAANEGAREAAWLEKLRAEIDTPEHRQPPTLYCDNEAATAFTKDSRFHNKAKHIEIKYMFARNDMISRNRLRVERIAGTDQIADVLTKQLPAESFTKHTKAMGLSKPQERGHI